MIATDYLPRSPELLEGVRLLLRLHNLALAGQADSKEASDACDEMGYPLHKLSKEQGDFLRNLSAVLNDIEDAPAAPETPLIHFANFPFQAACGADVPNQQTTQIREHMTCITCRTIMGAKGL